MHIEVGLGPVHMYSLFSVAWILSVGVMEDDKVVERAHEETDDEDKEDN